MEIEEEELRRKISLSASFPCQTGHPSSLGTFRIPEMDRNVLIFVTSKLAELESCEVKQEEVLGNSVEKDCW